MPDKMTGEEAKPKPRYCQCEMKDPFGESGRCQNCGEIIDFKPQPKPEVPGEVAESEKITGRKEEYPICAKIQLAKELNQLIRCVKWLMEMDGGSDTESGWEKISEGEIMGERKASEVGQYCWDCLHFKTREYRKVDENVKRHFLSCHPKLALELEKAKREKRSARYWRCALHQTVTEAYTLEQTARILKACKKFEDIR